MSSLTSRLRKMGRDPEVDLAIPLGGGQQLQVCQWLRILPGKRLVGRGIWQGQPVLAKLFIATGAERHWQRESNGIQALQRAGLPTPNLLASGELSGGGHYLLTEFLDGSQNLQERWEALPDQSTGSASAAYAIQQAAMDIIARMHARGLAQTDLHLANFLEHEGLLHVIDGDAIEIQLPGTPLKTSLAQSNLALFFAQFEVRWDVHLDALLKVYQEINPLPDIDRRKLDSAIRGIREQRLNSFLDKTLRDCSQFHVTRNLSRFCAVLRSEEAALAPLLADPDHYFNGAPLLKDGGTATVTRAVVAGRELVIKRYNIKSFSHWLKRFWRPSRAWHSWQAGWRLHFLGIATPQPLAMIERRIGPLRRQAWLVTEYCPGSSLLKHLGEKGDQLPDRATAQAMLQLFQQLAEARISHGDFKATNLLWHDGQLKLIDLDAMRAHRHQQTWHKAWLRDRSRLIRNWPQGSPLAKWLEQTLPQ